MSHRPIEAKKRRRTAKVFARTPLPAYLDLVQYLTDRGHANTKRQAREIILAKRVRADSHILGVGKSMVPTKSSAVDVLAGRAISFETKEVVEPFVSAKLRGRITVLP